MSAVWESRYHVPREGLDASWKGATRGHVHLHARVPVTLGRIGRAAGECVCSKRRGTREQAPRPDDFRCPKCESIAERYGIEWPDSVLTATVAHPP